MTNTQQPRTSRVPNEFASAGAVNQEGNLPLYTCNKCHAKVVWATSKKTGRKYLVTCYRKNSDYVTYFYIKNSIHTDEVCNQEIARNAEIRKQMESITEWNK